MKKQKELIMLHSSSNVSIDSLVVIGNASITPKLKQMGYIATICYRCDDPTNEYSFKDFNVTREHLEVLKSHIEGALQYFDKYGDSDV